MKNIFIIKQIALCSISSLAFSLSQAAYANPEGGIVAEGIANIQANGNKLDIHQQTDKAVIDWRSFNIEQNEHTQFHQPSANATALNRINEANPSRIMGKLSANGNVVLVNPNGVFFGKDSKVDVNGLIATTADIDNKDFMAGKMQFNKTGNPSAAIINQGEITAKEAGLVALVAPNVVNNGTINAKLGKVTLGSGDTATIDLYGDGLYEIKVSDKVASQLISNSGKINAEGGTIQITAAAGREIVNSLVAIEGELNAPTIEQKSGKIIISAEGSNAVAGNIAENKGVKQGSSTVLIANAKLDVSGRKAGERAGSVEVTADNIALMRGTIIDASGHNGASNTTQGKVISAHRIGAAGGDVKIGGDYLGKGTTSSAKNLYVDQNSYVFADSINQGDAGRVIFWSDDTTQFYGNVFARALGGNPVDLTTLNATNNPYNPNSGNGGFVETSGRRNLDAGGYVNLTASNGERGTYLLDPTNITIYGNVDPKFQSTDGSINLSTNLQLWLDGNDIDGDGTAEGTGEAGLFSGVADCGSAINCVGTWRDKSGNNNHATQSTAANRPRFSSNAQNNKDAITFDGNDDLMFSNIFLSVLNNNMTINTSVAANSPFSYQGLLMWRGTATGLNAANSTKWGYHWNDDSFTWGWTDGPAINVGNSQIVSLNVSPTFASMRADGGSDLVNNISNPVINDSSTPLRIGQDPCCGSRYFSGKIQEILIYNKNLITNENYLLDQYQSSKWGVGLDPISGTAIGGGAEVLEATAHNAASPNDAATNGYSVFTTRYLERLSQSANVSLQASNDIKLDLKGDTLNFSTAGRSLTLTAGNQITTASTGNITTNNGDINLNATNGISFNHAIELNAGTAGVNLNGGSGSLNLVNINAGSILARTTGASADITIPNSRTLTASGTGTAITLAAGRNIINDAGASALSANNGRWLLYSNNPTDTIGEQLLSSNFNRYNCPYSGCNAGVTIPTTGNGLIYSFVPTLTITGITSNKFFDGGTNAPLTTGTLNGIFSGDTGITINSSGVNGAFANSDVGTSKPITLSGSYSLNGNIYGYALTQPTGITGNIDNNVISNSNSNVIVSSTQAITTVQSNSINDIINNITIETPTLNPPSIKPKILVNENIPINNTQTLPNTFVMISQNPNINVFSNILTDNPIAAQSSAETGTITQNNSQNNESKNNKSNNEQKITNSKLQKTIGGLVEFHPKLIKLFALK